jgi:hypothetical protein
MLILLTRQTSGHTSKNGKGWLIGKIIMTGCS